MNKINKLRHGQEITSEFLNTLIDAVNELNEEHKVAAFNKKTVEENLSEFETKLAEISRLYDEKLASVPNFIEMLHEYLALNNNTYTVTDKINEVNSPIAPFKNMNIVLTDNIDSYILGQQQISEKTIIFEFNKTTVDNQVVPVNRLWFFYNGRLHNFSTDDNGNVTISQLPTDIVNINENGYWVINGIETEVPATGPRGMQGIAGPKGERGDKGDRGDTGLTGAQGIAGNPGKTPLIKFCSCDDEFGTGMVEEEFRTGKKYIGFKFVYQEDSDATVRATPWKFIRVVGDTYYPHVVGNMLHFSTTPPGGDIDGTFNIKGDKGDEGPQGPFVNVKFRKDGVIIDPTETRVDGTQIFDASSFKGDKGDPGQPGEQGPKGDDGAKGDPVQFDTEKCSIEYDDELDFPAIEASTYVDGKAGLRIRLPRPADGTKLTLKQVQNKYDDVQNYPYGYIELTFEELYGGVATEKTVKIPNGASGFTPTIGDDGKWYINGVSTNVSALGLKGDVGERGPIGTQGPQGEPGVGISSISSVVDNNNNAQVTFSLSNGTSSTVTLYHGPQGERGPAGADGRDGQSIQILGTVATFAALPTASTVATGGGYIVQQDETHDNTAGILYISTGSSWTYAGQVKGPKGDTGATGPQGPQGIQGIKGDTGTSAGFGTPAVITTNAGNVGTPSVSIAASGPDTAKVFTFTFENLKGQQGVKGDKGDKGSRIYSGSSVPTSSTPGELYDLYYVTSTSTFYQCSAVNNNNYTWTSLGSVKGQQGNAGADGNKIYTFSAQTNVAPTSSIVANPVLGDIAFNSTTYNVWHYNGSAWADKGSIKGADAKQITGVELDNAGHIKLTLDDNTVLTTQGSANGVGITSITGPVTNGLVDTYTINLDSGNTKTFTVTNGQDGEDGVGISSIDGPSTNQNNTREKTYTIHFTKNLQDKQIIVMDGEQGGRGPAGTDGTNIKVSGLHDNELSGQTSTSYKNGDLMISSDGTIFEYDSTSGWQTSGVNINGENGNRILIGDNTPSSNLGETDDLFISKTTFELYLKTQTYGWQSQGNLKGPQGSPVSLLDAWPVDSIYMSVNSRSPATLFGGTWVQLKDRFLLGAGDTYQAGQSLGSANVTLSVSNLPAHNHSISISGTTGTDSPDHSHNFSENESHISGDTYRRTTTENSGAHYTEYTSMTARYTGGASARHTHSFSWSGNTGNGDGTATPFSILPPYLVVYMWKRTA